ncbi:MAG TPA: ATP-binding protein [Bacteroidota bacterium]|nr:ATP-binding protein [Bacteroidota bacterium]
MKLTIYRKLMIGFGLVIFLLIIATIYVLGELQRVTGTSRSALTVDVQAIDLAKQMRTILYEEERFAQRYLISNDTAYRGVFTDNNRVFVRDLDSLSNMLSDQRELRLLTDAGEDHNRHFLAVLAADPRDPALNEKARTDQMDRVHKAIDDLIAGKQRSVSASVVDIERATRRSLQVAVTIAGGTFLAAIMTALLIARTITRPIRTLVTGTKQIAGGSFTRIQVRSRDEIADLASAFNSMSASLDALNRFRAEMMQHISHELRMPLQTMHSAYYLLTEKTAGPLNDRQMKLLNSMRENIDKIAHFSNQFLDLSKVEAGMMEYNYASTDLAAVVRPVIEDAGVTAARKEIDLTFEASSTPEVWVDREKCAEIVGNLLNNALKYTEKGGKVDVAVAPCPRGAVVTVRDTGPGIPPQDLQKIFNKFYRSSSAVKGRSRGTGIGLAFVKALVEGQGGKVYATSRMGAGSTFTVEFVASKVRGRSKA